MRILRQDYLTRQRSTPSQCLVYMFMHRYYLLGRWLLLPDCSWWMGKGRKASCDRAILQLPCHHITALGNAHTHCLSPHPFPQPLLSEAERFSHEVSTKSHFPFFWADHLIPAYAAKLYPALTGSCQEMEEMLCLIHLLTGYLLTVSFPLASSMLPVKTESSHLLQGENMWRWWF